MAVENLSCASCLDEKPGNFCVDIYGGKLKYPKLPEPDGLRKFAEPVQTPNQRVRDCEKYQKEKYSVDRVA